MAKKQVKEPVSEPAPVTGPGASTEQTTKQPGDAI